VKMMMIVMMMMGNRRAQNFNGCIIFGQMLSFLLLTKS
jgi:hypothetical protein